jgi:hypothetical protein
MQSRWIWTVLGVAGHLLTAAAFLWLTWATGRGPLVSRSFTGPELARLVRNAEALIERAATPGALALYAVPVAALIGAVLLAGAALTSSPASAARVAAGMGVVAAIICAGTMLLLAAGPSAGENLARNPGRGLIAALVGGILSCAGAIAASRSSPGAR